MKEGCHNTNIPQAGNRLKETTQLQTCATLHEKGRMTLRAALIMEDQPQALKPTVVCLTGFRNLQGVGGGQCFLFSYYFLSFQMGISLTVILCLSHHCILWVINLFIEFHKFTDEDCASGQIIPKSSHIADLDDSDDEIWNFGADEIQLRLWTLMP